MGAMKLIPSILALFILGVFASVGAKDASEIMDSMFQNQYDKRIRPQFGGAPVKVAVSSYILDVYNIDEKNHEFTAQLYLRQYWVDGRLAYQPPAGVKNIQLDPEHAKKLWIPDIFIVNERKSLKHELTVSNEFTRVSPDGEVFRSIRTTVTASCKMNLKWFPFDKHLCALEIESYGHAASDFVLEWKKNDQGKENIGVSEGAGGSINQEVTDIRGRFSHLSFGSGNYTRLAIEFIIVRTPTRYLQDVYFPAVALPIIGFITMSVGPLQFRVLLSTICMVGAIIFTALLSVEMPKVSYQTALDFYVFNSSVMLLNVLLVNFILYILHKPKVSSSLPTRVRMRQLNGASDDAKEILPEAEPSEDFNMGRPAFTSRFQELAYNACEKSKFTMPFFFVLFNAVYWPVVLIASSFSGPDFLLTEDHGS